MRNGILTAMAAALVSLGAGSLQPAHARGESELVRAWYNQYLQREPDVCGLRDWVRELRCGAGYEAVQAGILGSAEYYELHGCCPRSFVVGLYQDVLGRRPTRCEADDWVRRLSRCGCRVKLSKEFLCAAQLELNDLRPAPVVVTPAPVYVPVRQVPERDLRLQIRVGR